jgi:hypothetical protein
MLYTTLYIFFLFKILINSNNFNFTILDEFKIESRSTRIQVKIDLLATPDMLCTVSQVNIRQKLG